MPQHADPSMTFNDRYYGRDVRDTAERMESNELPRLTTQLTWCI